MAGKSRSSLASLDPGENHEFHKALESLEVNFSDLAPLRISVPLTKIADNMSSQPINILMSILPIGAQSMDNATVKLHEVRKNNYC